MRGLGGFVLLAGVGVGLFVYFPAPVDSGTTLQQATQALAVRHAADGEVAAHRPPSRVSQIQKAVANGGSRLGAFAPALNLAPSHSLTAAPTLSAPRVEKAALSGLDGWSTQVSAAVSSDGALAPTDADARYRLIVDIQQNLKRAGCYPGRVNGSWTANTREAMQEFTTRANATLPVEEPDYLLLTLLKSYNGRTCGGAEQVESASVAAGAGSVATAAKQEVLPWKANSAQAATRLYTPLPSSAANTAPLPGRMAIGGPRDFQPVPQQPLIPGSNVASLDQDRSAYSPPAAVPPGQAAAPKANRKVKKSNNSRRPARGTPRYNLMLSLGGVY
ncbi:peptidoglycan-binding domain-containing protein [Hyphomicrobium sp. D-2]|uniref:peptidoglycan-binding domain-containing protein n=1 Tax=Hyphomicrobium sp. D-2 TaxID=3041621 RepID=UPI00245882D1|nr:peptidoglycan-binding domain-containing protein [Hyphomicrobium sp. D-2]MDH4981276.1 peptidoglycan-binding domain-containing protein [Hyphomicrobium sp. D-2]